MSERHEIRTITDIVNLGPEKVDGFVKDLQAWLRLVHAVKALGSLTEDFPSIVDDLMIWVDDGNWGELSAVQMRAKK